jgi:hypothetical protein
MNVKQIQKRAYELTAKSGLRMDIHALKGSRNIYEQDTVIVTACITVDGQVKRESARIAYIAQLDTVMPIIVDKLKEGWL